MKVKNADSVRLLGCMSQCHLSVLTKWIDFKIGDPSKIPNVSTTRRPNNPRQVGLDFLVFTKQDIFLCELTSQTSRTIYVKNVRSSTAGLLYLKRASPATCKHIISIDPYKPSYFRTDSFFFSSLVSKMRCSLAIIKAIYKSTRQGKGFPKWPESNWAKHTPKKL